MSEPSPSDQALADEFGEVEVIDAVPVLSVRPATVSGRPAVAGGRGSSGGALVRAGGVVMPVVQAAAVAAGGFVAGAAVVGLVQRRQRQAPAIAKGRAAGRALGRGGRTAGDSAEVLQVLSSRSMLVDVHVLGSPRGDR